MITSNTLGMSAAIILMILRNWRGPCRDRTDAPQIKSLLLYQLS